MQVVLGCNAASVPPNLEELVQKRLMVAGTEIGGGKETGEYHAGFLHSWSDLNTVFGGNLERLRTLKGKYDPKNRFNKSVPLVAKG
jgi:FAD/FMN-containing dehydrogenase